MSAHLIEQIDRIDWDEEAMRLFLQLSEMTATDQCGAVVLVSAALLIAREFPEPTPREAASLMGFTEQFADLVFEMRKRLDTGRCRPARPVLTVVGGRDAG